MKLHRRHLLEVGLYATGSALFAGCASRPCPQPTEKPTPPPTSLSLSTPGLTRSDLEVLDAPEGPLDIVQRVPGEVNILRRRARWVTEADREVLVVFERRMRETLSATGGGVGLAGPQIGVGARGILVMLEARGQSPSVEFFLNPRIIERSDEVTADYEGCLSIQDLCGLVKRSRRIVVEHGLPGEHQRIEAADFDARIFQHEIDHLDGVLYIDRVEGGIHPREMLKELREKLREQQPEIACTPVIRGRHRDEVLL